MRSCCTIITASHIHYALALRASLLRFDEAVELNILVVDEAASLQSTIEKSYPGTHIYYTKEICREGIGKKIYDRYYDADLNIFRWSMKPVFINYLLQEKGFDQVIYLDCDIHFYNDYLFLWDELEQANVLLSPHWRSSDPHRDLPNFETLYTSGLYNGGFIGVTKAGVPAMQWWAMACEFICVKDAAKGMFVDQVHLNLLPIYFDRVHILKHRGCNIANWNMVECKRILADEDGNVLINNKWPIVFIHFTKSTIDGVSLGVDSLLRPYLEKYYAAVNHYGEQFTLPDLEMPALIEQVSKDEKKTTIQHLKNSVKRILKK